MIVIISCGAKKLNRPARARDLYIGPYFKHMLAYALTLAPAKNVYVLSAKYGLVSLNDRLKPYDLKMGRPGSAGPKTVSRQADRMGIGTEFVIALGGKAYTRVIRKVWLSVETPLEGKGGLGEQIAWMKRQTEARDRG
jgi:hypothetical protein